LIDALFLFTTFISGLNERVTLVDELVELVLEVEVVPVIDVDVLLVLEELVLDVELEVLLVDEVEDVELVLEVEVDEVLVLEVDELVEDVELVEIDVLEVLVELVEVLLVEVDVDVVVDEASIEQRKGKSNLKSFQFAPASVEYCGKLVEPLHENFELNVPGNTAPARA